MLHAVQAYSLLIVADVANFLLRLQPLSPFFFLFLSLERVIKALFRGGALDRAIH